jgi:hypothetical protein
LLASIITIFYNFQFPETNNHHHRHNHSWRQTGHNSLKISYNSYPINSTANSINSDFDPFVHHGVLPFPKIIITISIYLPNFQLLPTPTISSSIIIPIPIPTTTLPHSLSPNEPYSSSLHPQINNPYNLG